MVSGGEELCEARVSIASSALVSPVSSGKVGCLPSLPNLSAQICILASGREGDIWGTSEREIRTMKKLEGTGLLYASYVTSVVEAFRNGQS